MVTVSRLLDPNPVVDLDDYLERHDGRIVDMLKAIA
jgi:hypothetical protein